MRLRRILLFRKEVLILKELSIHVCPHCGKSIHPKHRSVEAKYYSFDNTVNNYYLVNIYECPSCTKDFIAVINYESKECAMIYPSPTETFDSFISTLSPDFINIYNQSLSAESSGLDYIAGMGYRKAAEFLIKDYLISMYPDYRDKIIESPISQCIQNTTAEGQPKYLPSIDNSNLTQISKRIIWLGNDETHYMRKHTDRDITDLKALIDIAIKHIILEHSTAMYISEIQPK